MSVSLCAQSHLCHVWGPLSRTLCGYAAWGWCKPITFELRGGLCGLIRDSLFMVILKVSWAWHLVKKAEFMRNTRLLFFYEHCTQFPTHLYSAKEGVWLERPQVLLFAELVDCLTQAKAAFRDHIFNNPWSHKALPLHPPFPVKSFLCFLKT